MSSLIQRIKTSFKRRLLIPVITAAAIFSLATYEFASPAKAAPPAQAASALDDNSVSALLSLDKAMETLAARVTPAIVNVTVTSKVSKHNAAMQDDSDYDDRDPVDRPTRKRTQPHRFRFELFLAFSTEHAVGLKHFFLLQVRRL